MLEVDDPPLGDCPRWCELPDGHDWEDEWPEGPMREHRCTVAEIDRYNTILVREYERHTTTGPVQSREISIELDTSVGWDIVGTQRVITALTTAMGIFSESNDCVGAGHGALAVDIKVVGDTGAV